MDIKCDTEKMYNASRDIEVQLERYNEILQQFYEIVDSFEEHGWVGTAAKNYSRYLNNRKNSYNEIYLSLNRFNKALKNNTDELNQAIMASKVGNDDKN